MAITKLWQRRSIWVHVPLLVTVLLLASFGTATPAHALTTIEADKQHYAIVETDGIENTFVIFSNATFSRLRGIPGDLFGPGCNDFIGLVNMTGVPVGPGDSSFIIERTENAVYPDDIGLDTVDAELVAMSLTSVNPFTVTGCDGGSQLWNASMFEDPNPPAGANTGVENISLDNSDSAIQINLCPRLVLTRVSDSSTEEILPCQPGDSPQGQQPMLLRGLQFPYTTSCSPEFVDSNTPLCSLPNVFATAQTLGLPTNINLRLTAATQEIPLTGTIIVRKDATPSDTGDTFKFRITPPGQDFELPEGMKLEKTFADLTPGTYEVEEPEELNPLAFESLGYNCISSDGPIYTAEEPAAMFPLNAGETVDCTFINVINDEDNDGVSDDRDLCMGTPSGVKVDNNGCPTSPPPVLDPIPADSVQENRRLERLLTAISNVPIGDGEQPWTFPIPLLASPVYAESPTFSVAGLPSFGTLTDHGDGTALLEFVPRCGDADVYTMTVSVTDSVGLSDSEDYTLTVTPDPACAEIGGPVSFFSGDEKGASAFSRSAIAIGATIALFLLAASVWYSRKRWVGRRPRLVP
ncbi:MAG: hypothetical protein ACE5Q6_02405 [Dehalococcoidia bacterium]